MSVYAAKENETWPSGYVTWVLKVVKNNLRDENTNVVPHNAKITTVLSVLDPSIPKPNNPVLTFATV